MEVHSREYRTLAARILRETPDVRTAVTGATLHFDGNRERGYAAIAADVWRRWAEQVKSHLLTHLDDYLEMAEGSLRARGIQVHWAETATDARALVRSLVERHGVRRAVKGKSMLSEELELNPLLEQLGVETFETDLGEYILQLLGEPPSHILGPAIHRSLEDIRTLFGARFGTPPDASPEVLARAARRVLREAFLGADLGITGGNFLVAETGTLSLIENEGNIRLSTSLPPVHVALVGIERLLPRWADLAPFLQITARAATGQPLGVFTSLIQGPGLGEEPDGPGELHVILVDNGRTRVLADPEVWEVLRCVRCSACLNVCPVYRQTGGHAYGWIYSGPLGAVLNPGLLGLEQTYPLPHASTLCGACYDVCPVRIPIPRLLLEWRRRGAEAELGSRGESRLLAAYAAGVRHPGLYRAASRALRLFPGILRDPDLPVLRDWTRLRSGLEPSPHSFHRLWAAGLAGEAPPGGDRGQPAQRAAPEDGKAVPEPGRPVDPPLETELSAVPPPVPDPTTLPLPPDHSRERILERVRSALRDRAPIPHPGPLTVRDGVAAPPPPPTTGAADSDPTAPPSRGDVIQEFTAQFRAAGGEVVRFADLAEARTWLREFQADFVGFTASPLLPTPLQPDGPAARPEAAALGISLARGAVAATGTVLVDSREGRRLQLLPPTHLVWVHETSIHATLGEALEAVRDDLPAALGLHSGPSKSADIGRVMVTGVHGPGRVVAAIVP